MEWSQIDPLEHKRRMGLKSRVDEVFHVTADWDFLEEFFTPNITVEELLRQYAAGERDFIDICVPERSDLSGVNLRGANLMGAKLNGQNGINLTGANLSYAWLTGSNLTGIDLTGANLSYAKLSLTDLTGANLTGVNFTGAAVNASTFVDIIYDGKFVDKTSEVDFWRNKRTLGSAGLKINIFIGWTMRNPDGTITVEGTKYYG